MSQGELGLIRCRYCSWTTVKQGDHQKELMRHARKKHTGAKAFKWARADARDKGCPWCGGEVRFREYDGVNPVEVECQNCGECSTLHHGLPTLPLPRTTGPPTCAANYHIEYGLYRAIYSGRCPDPERWARICTYLYYRPALWLAERE